ncbi:MAG: DUF2249 domain-containing protein [Gordonia sp. (in: high G+C Gram-positive bacteria)]|uniref:DUF2249 domain-containing protein n=1 Tax=Gordonia sp. (in: high G+C Gram-positive bacteria) TaxID=84139 RepID=UPI003C758D18
MTSNDVVMASNAADADTLEQQRQAVAELMGRMAALDSGMLKAATSGTGVDEARTAVAAFATGDVEPWLEAARKKLLPEALNVGRARLLVEGLAGESRVMSQLVKRVNTTGADAVNAAADTTALRVLMEVFFGKVTDMLMPALAEDSSVSLADLVADLPTVSAAPAPAAGGHAGCSCGEHDTEEPELDVRQIPHAIRHATVFGAFDAVADGESMILVAHHDPVPLLHQLADRSGGHIQVEYLEQGPEAWRLRLSKI